MILHTYYKGSIRTISDNSTDIIYRNLETVNDYKTYNTKHLFYNTNYLENIIPWLYDKYNDKLYIYDHTYDKYVNSNNKNDSFSII
jgi:hypothetical protein